MRSQEERVLTLHPDPRKSGVRIRKATYEAMRRALLKVIPRRKEGVAFADLGALVRPHLAGSAFPEGASVTWYVVTVKQDLEARGRVERVPGARPQRVRRR